MAWSLIGKDFIPPDIRGKVTGRAKYAEDFRAEGMVFARLLTSPVPHATITNIDFTEALAMDGVLGILTADDQGLVGGLTNEAQFGGDPILALAAIDETTAQDAIDRIELEFAPLPFTVDPLESLYPGGPDGRVDGTNVGGGRTGLQLRRVRWPPPPSPTSRRLPAGLPAPDPRSIAGGDPYGKPPEARHS